MNHIVKREYYMLEISLSSPLCVSSGIQETTDSDIMRNYDGIPFVPGTSIAGALRNYLGTEKKEKSVMGYSDGNEGVMSSIFVSDLTFEDAENMATSVRDGIKIGEDKIVEDQGKFDLEIIETGAQGKIYIETVFREKDGVDTLKTQVNQWIAAIEKGEIRFGSKKNRGFGRMKIQNVYYVSFESSDKAAWMEFMKNKCRAIEMEKNIISDWRNQEIQEKYITIKIPLKMKGGISIRRYSTKPQEADYEHITCNGVPVIPGAGWNGAIRADISKTLTELQCHHTKELLDQWFGYVHGNKAKQSSVVIGESRINNAKRLSMTRNKINRFDQSTIDGALYSEISYFDGATILEIKIKKDDQLEYKALAGALMIALKDIQKGYLAIGGQTAIGRGVFESDGRDIEWSEKMDETECMSALYAACME